MAVAMLVNTLLNPHPVPVPSIAAPVKSSFGAARHLLYGLDRPILVVEIRFRHLLASYD